MFCDGTVLYSLQFDEREGLVTGALDRIWKRLNQELFRTLGPDRYSLWIRHALPATFDEELFTIHFPTTHAKDKVESLLREAVSAAAQRVTNRT